MSTTTTSSPLVDAILEANAGRKPGRVRLKMRAMAASAFGFFRGTDHLFARSWSSLALRDPGPSILLCGDLHLENFGAFRTESGEFRYDINDFDESIVAPCSFDLIRCTTSILLAAEQWGLTPTHGTGMVLAYLEAYRESVAAWDRDGVIGEIVPGSGHGPIWDLLGATAIGTQAEMLDRQTRLKASGRRVLIRTERHPEVGKKRAKTVIEAIEHHGSKLEKGKSYEVLDLTGRIAGIGSLGVRRYLALVRGDGTSGGNWLLDVKEAVPSSVKSCATPEKLVFDGDEAQRVVSAQIHLQGNPPAGLAAMTIDGRPFRVRVMIPKESRASLDRLQRNAEKLTQAVEMAGRLTGWAQIRGARLGDGDDRTAALVQWTQTAALEALLAASVRDADRTIREFREFRREYREGRVEVPSGEKNGVAEVVEA